MNTPHSHPCVFQYLPAVNTDFHHKTRLHSLSHVLLTTRPRVPSTPQLGLSYVLTPMCTPRRPLFSCLFRVYPSNLNPLVLFSAARNPFTFLFHNVLLCHLLSCYLPHLFPVPHTPTKHNSLTPFVHRTPLSVTYCYPASLCRAKLEQTPVRRTNIHLLLHHPRLPRHLNQNKTILTR